MLFEICNRNKTVKELRKNVSLTVEELALKIKCEPIQIKKIDHLKLKEIPKDLYQKLIPIFKQESYDNVPW